VRRPRWTRQAGEREVRFRLGAPNAQHTFPAGFRDRPRAQRRLADARIAGQHERAAALTSGTREHAADACTLQVPADHGRRAGDGVCRQEPGDPSVLGRFCARPSSRVKRLTGRAPPATRNVSADALSNRPSGRDVGVGRPAVGLDLPMAEARVTPRSRPRRLEQRSLPDLARAGAFGDRGDGLRR
jgi:hypothetical protein